MKLKNKKKPTVPQMEAGTYPGVCVGVYAIGEQEAQWNDKTRYREELILVFEFPGETVEIEGEEKPRQLSRTFTATTSERGGLRKFLKDWRGKDFKSEDEMGDFELTKLLGQSALISVTLSEKGYANIGSAMKLPKGMPDPDTDTELLSFDVDEWDDDAFDKLPEWIQNKVKNSMQYKNDHAPDAVVDFPEEDPEDEPEPEDDEEDVPF